MEQELWYRWRERDDGKPTSSHFDEGTRPVQSDVRAVDGSRRRIGRALVRLASLIAAERYVPVTR